MNAFDLKFPPVPSLITNEDWHEAFKMFARETWVLNQAAQQPASTETAEPTFQDRVAPWMAECFGPEISADRTERNHRFLEEAIELVQACGCTADEAHQLVDYVFGRPVGEPAQEVGGVMVTLAALCLANGLSMHEAGETELARIWTKVEQIRAKQAAKPRHSPLPATREAPADNARVPYCFHIKFNNGRDAYLPMSDWDDCKAHLESNETMIKLYQ